MRIKVIKPKKDAAPKRLRVCAYVRVSAATEELEESLEAQMDHFQTLITSKQEWEFVGLYIDNGISGFQNKRPGFQAMMKDARAGKLDFILVKSVSRFARNTETLLKATRELKSLGIGVYFELQKINTLTVSGELMLTIKAAFAQGESDSGRDLMKMAIRHRFEKGIPSPRTRTTYGFLPANDGSIVIDEKCADTVRMVYDLAEQGVWYSKIRAKLNKMGIPSPTGTLWNDGQIADMLHNVMYKGDLLLQKSYKDENRQTCRNEGQVQSWYVHDDHEAIVSSEQWERVQQVLAARSARIAEAKERRKAASAHHEHVGRYPLTGLLFCPHCGAVLHHKWCNNGRDEYWVCSTNIKKRASSCKGIFLPSSIADSWNIEAPVVVQRFKDENGMVQFTAYPKDEYEAMKGE